MPDWRGYLAGLFAVVWIANLYISVFAWLRQELKHETLEAKRDEIALDEEENGAGAGGGGGEAR